jgi:hypothetical protein
MRIQPANSTKNTAGTPHLISRPSTHVPGEDQALSDRGQISFSGPLKVPSFCQSRQGSIPVNGAEQHDVQPVHFLYGTCKRPPWHGLELTVIAGRATGSLVLHRQRLRRQPQIAPRSCEASTATSGKDLHHHQHLSSQTLSPLRTGESDWSREGCGMCVTGQQGLIVPLFVHEGVLYLLS